MSLISLQQARSWLRYPNSNQASSDDAALQTVIGAVEEIVEMHAGICSPKRYVEKHSGGDYYSIWLREVPVISVSEVLESWGPIAYSLDYVDATTGPVVYGGTTAEQSNPVAASVFAFSLDQPETGKITRRSVANSVMPFMAGDDNIQVTYVAGRETMPYAVQLAAQELVAHIWQNSQLRSVAMSGGNIGYDAVTGQAWSRDDQGNGGLTAWVGIPYRIIAFLESEKVRLPVIA